MADDPIIKKLDDVKTSISGSIDKLAKQNAERDRKSEKITLEENIGSLAEVAATFKAQSKQMEHEKKEKMHEVDDRLDDMLKQDKKYQKEHLDITKNQLKADGQADSQETETKRESSQIMKRISSDLSGIGKSMLKWSGLASIAKKGWATGKITLMGALLAGAMIALIKFLDSKTWQDFQKYVTDPKGMAKDISEFLGGWKNIQRILFNKEGKGPMPGIDAGKYGSIPSGHGFFPWLAGVFKILGSIAWAWGVKPILDLIKDMADPKKSWFEVLKENLFTILGVGGALWLLAVGFSPVLLWAGLFVGGAWLIHKVLADAGTEMIGALTTLAVGMFGIAKGWTGDKTKGGGKWNKTGVSPFNRGKEFKSGASKTGWMKWNPQAQQFQDWRQPDPKTGGKGKFVFNAFRGGMAGSGSAGIGAEEFAKHKAGVFKGYIDRHPRLGKIMKMAGGIVKPLTKAFGPLAAVFTTYQGYRILTDPEMSDNDKAKQLGALLFSTIGSFGMAALGAMVGMGVGGPLGAIGGGLVGAFGGGWVGGVLGEHIMTYLLGGRPPPGKARTDITNLGQRTDQVVGPIGNTGWNSGRQLDASQVAGLGGAGQKALLKTSVNPNKVSAWNVQRKDMINQVPMIPPKHGDVNYERYWSQKSWWNKLSNVSKHRKTSKARADWIAAYGMHFNKDGSKKGGPTWGVDEHMMHPSPGGISEMMNKMGGTSSVDLWEGLNAHNRQQDILDQYSGATINAQTVGSHNVSHQHQSVNVETSQDKDERSFFSWLSLKLGGVG